MKKLMTFHGVGYIVVPVDLWQEAQHTVKQQVENPQNRFQPYHKELHEQMLTYEGSDEPEELK